MSSIIKSDNGVSSGVTSIVQTAVTAQATEIQALKAKVGA